MGKQRNHCTIFVQRTTPTKIVTRASGDGASAAAHGLTSPASRRRSHGAKTRPVEVWSRVGLAPWGDVGMPDDVLDRIARAEGTDQGSELPILRRCKRHAVAALEFNPNREVIAAFAAAPVRHARVPRALPARHELDERAVATDEEMGGDPKPGYARVIRVRRWVQPVGEKIENAGAAKLPRRQADAVYDQQVDGTARRSLVAVR